MKYTEPGTYKIQYTAEDGCGKTTVADRTVIVEAPPTYRTVLYTDGTLIINESSVDEASNIAEHGVATNVYIPFDPNGATLQERYEFSKDTESNPKLWKNEKRLIKSVEIGSKIQPYSLNYWFEECFFLVSADLRNMDTSNVTSMISFFLDCYDLESIEGLDGFDTSNVTNFSSMFYSLDKITTLDVSSFDTSNAIRITNMFARCDLLQTIYASTKFDVSHLSTVDSEKMFESDTSLIGGAGTVFNSSYINNEYAHIDGGTSNPGYFTLKEE